MLQRAQFWIPLSLGMAHALADCTSGFLIGTLPADAPSPLLLVIGYNALAFAGQVPAGILADKLCRPKLLLAMSLGAILLALLLKAASPVMAVCLAGAGSALFHVSGGLVTLRLMPDRAGAAGLFTGPGVMGLALGGLFAALHFDAVPLVAGLLAIAVVGMALLPLPKLTFEVQAEKHAAIELHDVVMLLLLMGIAFRSVVWNVMEHAWQGNHAMLLAMAGAAMTGKLAGGWLADWLGWRRFTFASLAGAALLLSLPFKSPWLLLPGIALLQSATPIALAAMHRAMPRYPGAASGLALGLAIAAGGIPFAVPAQAPTLNLAWVLPPIAAALLLYALALARLRAKLKG
jgi:FSR family fosmidomycin resistance protein-like MFS transporter